MLAGTTTGPLTTLFYYLYPRSTILVNSRGDAAGAASGEEGAPEPFHFELEIAPTMPTRCVGGGAAAAAAGGGGILACAGVLDRSRNLAKRLMLHGTQQAAGDGKGRTWAKAYMLPRQAGADDAVKHRRCIHTTSSVSRAIAQLRPKARKAAWCGRIHAHGIDPVQDPR